MEKSTERVINHPRPAQAPKQGNLQKGSSVTYKPSPILPNSKTYHGADLPESKPGAMI